MSTSNLYPMSSATSDQPVTQPTADRSAREALIRDLYAVVAFYLADPFHPLPWSITINHHAPAGEVERVAAERSKGHVYGDVPQCHHDLAGTSVPVTMIITVPREDRPL